MVVFHSYVAAAVYQRVYVLCDMLRHSVQLLCLELVILWAVPKEWISGTLGFWPAK